MEAKQIDIYERYYSMYCIRALKSIKPVVVLLLCFWLSCSAHASETIKVSISGHMDENGKHTLKMLKLALDQVDEEYKIKIKKENLSRLRLEKFVNSGDIDIMWATTSLKMEKTLIPIRIPLFKGLMGHRVIMTKKKNVDAFAEVTSLKELKKFSFCQGKFWTDSKILSDNRLKVMTSTDYHSLFRILDIGRCFGFPRGINEPWFEMRAYEPLDLAVENHILLKYTNPFYIFVSPTRKGLAKVIEKGFELAIENGSFEKAFLESPMVIDGLKMSNIEKRKQIHLINRFLPKETPIDDPRLWHFPLD